MRYQSIFLIIFFIYTSCLGKNLKYVRNDQLKSAVLVDAQIPARDEKEKDVIHLLKGFFDDLRSEFHMRRRRVTHNASGIDQVYDSAMKMCVLVTSPSIRNAQDDLQYDFVMDEQTKLHRVKKRIEHLLFRNASSKRPTRGRRDGLKLYLFSSECRKYTNLEEGAPAIPIFVRKFAETSTGSWDKRVQENVVNRMIKAKQTFGLLIVTNTFAEMPKFGFNKTIPVKIHVYDLGHPAKPISTFEDPTKTTFGGHSRRVARHAFDHVRKGLLGCAYAYEFAGCYYKRPHACRQSNRRVGSQTDENARKYCYGGYRFKVGESDKCAGQSTCDRECAKFVRWTSCNITCGYGYRWMYVHLNKTDVSYLWNCPAQKVPKFEKCYGRCSAPIWPKILIIVSSIMFGFFLITVILVYCIQWRENPPPKDQHAPKGQLAEERLIEDEKRAKSSQMIKKSKSGRGSMMMSKSSSTGPQMVTAKSAGRGSTMITAKSATPISSKKSSMLK